MNLLVHLRLANRSDTSAAGQILGDIIKGRIDRPRFDPHIDHGIRLHRAIDSASDTHPAHRELRQRFEPPLRRYAGILVDIGFDHVLAQRWHDYSPEPLDIFAYRMAKQVANEWPVEAPVAAPDVRRFARMLVAYACPPGVERALAAVGRRAARRNPLAGALPALMGEYEGFAARLPVILNALDEVVATRSPGHERR